MKSIKWALLIFICVLTAFAFCGCELIINKFKTETKDTNGDDDYSLTEITDDDICAKNCSCYCAVYGFAPSGSKSYPDEDLWHDADLTEAIAATPFSGVALLQTTYGTEDTVTFTVECTRTAGNMRIVLLDENSDIIYDFGIEEKSSYTANEAKGKKFEIRVAGENAKFTVNVSRAFSAE